MKLTFNFKKNKSSKPEGLGDVVENVTKATGIKSLTEIAMSTYNRAMGTKKDCGCNKRKKWLNKKFPFNTKE